MAPEISSLVAAGIDRSAVYVTNVVKHFKWEPRGKRRLHKKPLPSEIAACMPWLRMEIELVRPEIIVCLGATAAQSLLGPKFRVTEQRGVPIDGPGRAVIVATVHPSSILRMPDEAARAAERERFIADLRVAKRLLDELST